MSDTELVESLRAAGSRSNAQSERLPIRVLLRLALTALLAIPVCLALALFSPSKPGDESRPPGLRRPRARTAALSPLSMALPLLRLIA